MAVNIMTKLHNDLLRDIGTLARTIHYLHDLHFKELALQRGQFIFLTRICENTGINQNDLSLLLKVDKSTTAKAVQKLTAAGYIGSAAAKTSGTGSFSQQKKLSCSTIKSSLKKTPACSCVCKILQRQNAKN